MGAKSSVGEMKETALRMQRVIPRPRRRRRTPEQREAARCMFAYFFDLFEEAGRLQRELEAREYGEKQ